MPSVSFIIPSYNYGRHIADAICSVQAVMQSGDELIVVDDGSTDNTRDVLAGWINDGSLVYIHQENGGVSSARNTGARAAANDYLYFLDADDEVIKEGFSALRNAVDTKPECAMLFAGHVTVEGDRQREHLQRRVGDDREQNFHEYVIGRCFSIANGGVVLIKREIALQYPYPQALRVSEDFCVYAWILANEPVASIPEAVVRISKHEDSLRNQLAGYDHVVDILPDILFDEARLPASLLHYRKQFYCNRLLSLFRAQYLSGQCKVAIATYRKAIGCRWLNLFKLSYLRKYIRCLLKI